jgi:hypothetical protein
MTTTEAITYIRSRKGGQRPRDSRSFTFWRFGELCECLGFEEAERFAKFVERTGLKGALLDTYKTFKEHEDSIRNQAAHS